MDARAGAQAGNDYRRQLLSWLVGLTAYYNEIDPFAAEWLRELIKAGHIAPGIVDTRSIEDVEPADLLGFTQCHFFAGIGVWSYALRQAKWPDSRSVWTGSCPCQPFSAAGKRTGTADLRHLWPAWFHLIASCRPKIVFGEQVEAAIKHGWLDLVQADLEGSDYACTPVCLPAAGVGAPHIRSRLYFVAEDGQLADTERSGWRGRRAGEAGHAALIGWGEGRLDAAESSSDGIVGHAEADRREGPSLRADREQTDGIAETGFVDESVFAERTRLEGFAGDGDDGNESRRLRAREAGSVAAPGLTNGFWRDAEWLWCRDGKYRPVEPGTFPLVNGAANRVGRLRGYGNAIVAPVAQAFIEAYLNATS
jgi:DNA (cytosine-5)-methyltransferase 1